jgi:hypothetical protein
MTPVILFVEWVCGPDYESMTYGERDAKIIQKAKEMGRDLSHLGPDGWCLAKDNHHFLCNTIGEAIQKLIDSLPRVCALEPV